MANKYNTIQYNTIQYNTIIVQPWVLFKSMVLEGTFLFAINGFREFKLLRWLVWLIIDGYFRHGVTTSTLGLFNGTMLILLLMMRLLLQLLQLVTWFEEKPNFFLFDSGHFQLFTKGNQKLIC